MKPVHFAVRICVEGELGPDWFAMFDGLRVEPAAGGTTVISGDLPDQSAFHGLLAAIRDLGLSLVSAECAASPEEPDQAVSNPEGK